MNYIAYIVTAASITGTVANSFQKKWCFWVWICTNIFWCTYNAVNKQYAQALLYAFNFVMCIVGLRKWKKHSLPKEQKTTPLPHFAKGGIITDSDMTYIPTPEDNSKSKIEFNIALGNLFEPVMRDLIKMLREFTKCIIDFEAYKSTAANKRVLHLAYHSKKHRTSKKNLSRLSREYKKYIKSGGSV